MKRLVWRRARRARFNPIPAFASIALSIVAIAAVEHADLPVVESSGAGDRLLLGEFALHPGEQLPDVLRDLGVRPMHIFHPDAAIVWAPDDAIPNLLERWPLLEVYKAGEALADLAPDGAARTPSQEGALAFWRAKPGTGDQLSDSSPVAAPPEPFGHDALARPESPGKGAGDLAGAGAPAGASFWDLSEYMLGDVAVSVVLVESNGAIDANSENWTQGQRDQIAVEVPAAFNWWIAKAGARPLSITYSFADASTGYEPITRPQTQEGLWIAEAMASLGYASGDYFTRAATYDNALRDAQGTDWAVTLFIANSFVDPDGKFSDNFFAYAYLGGPFIVMTYDNNGWGIANMDAVLAHEFAHTFYALDEYATANQPCDKRSGYLNAENGNSALPGCPMNQPNSIMRSVVLSAAVLDSFTMGQIGWWDGDLDGTPNPADTEPAAAIAGHAPTGGNPYVLTFSGSAQDIPLANQNPFGYGHDITLNEIALVEWRVDGGAWTAASPADGAWDASSEDWSFVTGTLGLGTHIVQVRAGNSESNVQSSADAETVVVNAVTSVEPGGPVVGLPAAAPPATLGPARPNPARSETEILWSLRDPADVVLAIYDASGRRVRVLQEGRYAPGSFSAVWNGRDDAGADAPAGRYFYRLDAAGFHDSRKLTLVR